MSESVLHFSVLRSVFLCFVFAFLVFCVVFCDYMVPIKASHGPSYFTSLSTAFPIFTAFPSITASSFHKCCFRPEKHALTAGNLNYMHKKSHAQGRHGKLNITAGKCKGFERNATGEPGSLKSSLRTVLYALHAQDAFRAVFSVS